MIVTGAVLAVAGLVLPPSALAGRPATADLVPSPPDFYTCMAAGEQTICHGDRVAVEDPVDTGIACGNGDSAFDAWDQGTEYQHAARYYNADGRLTRRVNHERWAPAWWSNPLNGTIIPYTQSETTTTVLAVPGDLSSGVETTSGEIVFSDPLTGRKLMMEVGRQTITENGELLFRSGKQPFLDAFFNDAWSGFDALCAALAR